MYEFLKKYPKIKIEIIQHTDSRGSATTNQNLSTKQAESAKHYLEKKGISPDRIIAIGKGESEPIYKEDEINKYKTTNKVKYEEMHKVNRRTIVRITAI